MKQGRFVFLDDIRNPKDCFYYTNNPIYTDLNWIIVRNYDEFVNDILNNGISEIYSFDHDLADIHYKKQGAEINYSEYTEKTGYDCIKWLVDYCIECDIPFPNYKVHSMNIVGELNMISYIENYNRQR